MTKTEVLNTMTYYLASTYFSDEKFEGKRYVHDWILNAAVELNKSFVKMDIINKRTEPFEFESEPVISFLNRLHRNMDKRLVKHKMPLDFLTEAYFELSIDSYSRKIYCNGYVIDKYERRYRSEPYIINSKEKFRVFYPPVIQKIRKLLKRE